MKIELRPKSYFRAIHVFMEVPFYTFKDLITKNKLTFEESEVIKFGHDPAIPGLTTLHYLKNNQKGSFEFQKKEFENIEDQNFPSYEYKYNPYLRIIHSFGVLFNRHSPFIWGAIIHLITTYIIIESVNIHHFGLNPNGITLSGCDTECVTKAYRVVAGTWLHTYIRILPFFIFFYFYFYHHHKIKNGNTAGHVRYAASVIFLMALFNSTEVIHNLTSDSTAQAFKISYFPEKERAVKRGIASELEKSFIYQEIFVPKKSFPQKKLPKNLL